MDRFRFTSEYLEQFREAMFYLQKYLCYNSANCDICRIKNVCDDVKRIYALSSIADEIVITVGTKK